MADWAGMVLAGGASTRMGTDKAQLEWRGRTLLDHAVARLEAFGAGPVVVSGDRPGFDAVPDLVADQGPLGGLYSVLSQRPGLEAFWLMVLPVDMPQLGEHSLHRLAREAEANGRGTIFETGPLPMALAPGRQRLKALKTIIEESDRRALRALIDALSIAEVASEPGDRLGNVNDPETWRALSGA